MGDARSKGVEMSKQKRDGGAAEIGVKRQDGTWFMDAYYYSFEPTGNDAIDALLSEVARAGKAYHHTDNWCEEYDPAFWGEGFDKRSHAQRIQDAANAAADAMLAAREEGK